MRHSEVGAGIISLTERGMKSIRVWPGARRGLFDDLVDQYAHALRRIGAVDQHLGRRQVARLGARPAALGDLRGHSDLIER